MKVQFVPATGAKIVVELKDGTKLDNDDIESVHAEPFFSMANGMGEVVTGVSITSSGDVVDRFTLVASSTTGKVSCKRATVRSGRPNQPRSPA